MDSSTGASPYIAKYLRKALFMEHRRGLLLAFTSISVIFFTLTHPRRPLREADVRRCFSRKVILKVFANFAQNTCV